MEQTPPSTGFYDFLGWLDVNKKRIAIAAGIVAVIAAVVALVIWRKGQREIEAGEALSAIRTALNPMEPPPVGTAEAFVKVAREYSGTRAGDAAVLRAASAYFAEGNYAQAQQQFGQYLQKQPDPALAPQAVFGIAASLDAQGKTADAIAKYNDYLRTYPNDPAVDQARLNLARLYEAAKQPAQAFELLNKIAAAGPMAASASEAQEKLRELQARHPELAPTNVAPLRPTMPEALRTNMFTATNMARPTNLAQLTNMMRATNMVRPRTSPLNSTAAPPKINLQTPGPNNQPGK